jgi:hypothetical protein
MLGIAKQELKLAAINHNRNTSRVCIAVSAFATKFVVFFYTAVRFTA